MLSLSLPPDTAWRYSAPAGRDLRIDFLRGWAMTMVIVMHLRIPSLWHLMMLLGFVSVVGAEVFVLLSGVSAGTSVRERLRTESITAVRRRIQRRAGALWLVCIAMSMGVWLLEVAGVPGVEIVNTWQRHDTPVRTMPVAELANFPAALLGSALLQAMPWPPSTLGLFVILFGVVGPVAVTLLARGRTVWLLAASAAVWAANIVLRIRLPFMSELIFPVLGWQFAYVLGISAGWHRAELAAAVRTRQRWLVAGAAVLVAMMALFMLNTPWSHGPFWSDLPWWPRLRLIAPRDFNEIYQIAIGAQPWLHPGRLLCVLAAAGLAFLGVTRWWVPCERALGWLFLPFGRHPLMVFNVHIVTIVMLGAVPALASGGLLGNTLVHLGAVLVVLAIVRLLGAAPSPAARTVPARA
jgi:hypothetical protein